MRATCKRTEYSSELRLASEKWHKFFSLISSVTIVKINNRSFILAVFVDASGLEKFYVRTFVIGHSFIDCGCHGAPSSKRASIGENDDHSLKIESIEKKSKAVKRRELQFIIRSKRKYEIY